MPAWIQDRVLDQHAYITWYSDVTRETRHFKAIQFVGARGVLPGEAFRPDEALTVEDTAAALDVLIRLEGPVGAGHRACPAPAEPITRGEFAKWLVESKRAVSADWQYVEPARPSYKDVGGDSPYYVAVETLRAHRIEAWLFAGGTPDEFKPDDPITRADAAEAIYLAHREAALNGLDASPYSRSLVQ